MPSFWKWTNLQGLIWGKPTEAEVGYGGRWMSQTTSFPSIVVESICVQFKWKTDWLNFPMSLLNVCISEDRLHMTLVINRKQSICQYGIFYNITLIYSRKKDKIKKLITKKSLPHELPWCRPFWTSEGLLGASEGLCTGFSKLFASSKWKSV